MDWGCEHVKAVATGSNASHFVRDYAKIVLFLLKTKKTPNQAPHNTLIDMAFKKTDIKLGIKPSLDPLACVYCYSCSEFVDGQELEKRRLKVLCRWRGLKMAPGSTNPRTNGTGTNGTGTNGTNGTNGTHTPPSSFAQPSISSTRGLRGLVNMGATCFMSVIVQTLIHNPLIRNDFLAQNHSLGLCALKRAIADGTITYSDFCDYYEELPETIQRESRDLPLSTLITWANATLSPNPNNCIACALDDCFSKFYASATVQGYGPVSLMISSWNINRQLAGYSQQDAHEFWQFLVNELHGSSLVRVEEGLDEDRGASSDIPVQFKNTWDSISESGSCSDTSDCTCISHRTFGGTLQSTATCNGCSHTSHTYDPLMDLSLQIPLKGQASLSSCLDKYTAPEQMEYFCENCKSHESVSKTLALKKPPVVLSFQLKRFQHTGSSSSKIDTHVEFPLYLDMSPYTCSQESGLVYELYAVVCHHGSLNTGHYTCMVKGRDMHWYNFDDVTITRVDVQQVLAARAYLLFYIMHKI
ncbi:hypothetical protein B0I73DRAFT_135599 [Yarrowia lipolytica]|nr:hypothetical protein B0I73DRAFT_135599 [Yarrowia lipolytica]